MSRRRLVCHVLAAAAVISWLSLSASAQAPPNLPTAQVRYNALKNVTNPQGELKAQIDAIDQEIARASRLGETSQVRRLLAKGTALLNGRPWTELDDFQQSLVLRTDRLLIDPSTPYVVRLEQTYAPAIELARPLSATATLRSASSSTTAATGSNSGATAAPPVPAAREVAQFADVPRDLRDAPFTMPLDLSAVENGVYALRVEVLDHERPLGTVTLAIAVQKNLDTRLRALEAAAASVSTDVRADLRYPGDYVRKINRGLVEMDGFNIANELAAAEAVLASVKARKNIFAGRTGDFERHYELEAAGEIMPYRVYVPSRYDGSRPFPLVIALHGLGQTEDSFFDRYSKRVPALAEERGYIVAAPLGYRVDGFYGTSIYANDAAGRRRAELSEQDVMEVLRRMREQYKIDPSRIYLLGHSMGAIGAWALGSKYSDIWAALAPFAGLGSAASAERMRHIPQFVVHGDADATVPVRGSRSMVEALKQVGAQVVYVEVPGGNHTDVVVPNLPGAFDFFDKHRKTTVMTQQQR